MIADLCRIYHYSLESVISMPMKQASFLWGRGILAERMQAYRIAGAMNGVDIDKEQAKVKEQKRVFRTGQPSPEAQAIIDNMLKEVSHD